MYDYELSSIYRFPPQTAQPMYKLYSIYRFPSQTLCMTMSYPLSTGFHLRTLYLGKSHILSTGFHLRLYVCLWVILRRFPPQALSSFTGGQWQRILQTLIRLEIFTSSKRSDHPPPPSSLSPLPPLNLSLSLALTAIQPFQFIHPFIFIRSIHPSIWLTISIHLKHLVNLMKASLIFRKANNIQRLSQWYVSLPVCVCKPIPLFFSPITLFMKV